MGVPRRRWRYIERLPSGSFRASHATPDGPRLRKTLPTKRDAERLLTSQHELIESGRFLDPRRRQVRLGEYFRDEFIARRPLRPKTVENYEWLFKTYIER